MGEKNLELTQEIKERLRGYCAIDIHRDFEYTPKAYKKLPSEYRPKFQLRKVDGSQDIVAIKDNTVIDPDTSEVKNLNWGGYALDICRQGIVGWENYYDIDGKTIPYNKECRGLPKALIYELCNVILGDTDLTEEESSGLK